MRRKGGVPVVLEDVHFALSACITGSSGCSERASAIDCDCCAEEVAGGERGGGCEDLQVIGGEYETDGIGVEVGGEGREGLELGDSEVGGEFQREFTFWRLREKSLTAAGVGRGELTKRRRRMR